MLRSLSFNLIFSLLLISTIEINCQIDFQPDTVITEMLLNELGDSNDTCWLRTEAMYWDSVPLIFNKVFPQVKFSFKRISNSCVFGEGEDSQRLYFTFLNQDYNPYHSFNSLISKMTYNEPITLNDKILAYITLIEYLRTNSLYNDISIENVKQYSIQIDTILPDFNKLVNVRINGTNEIFYIKEFETNVYFLAKVIDDKYIETDKRRYKIYGMEPLPLILD